MQTDGRAGSWRGGIRADYDRLQDTGRRVDSSVPAKGAATDLDAAAMQAQIRDDHDRMQASARRVDASIAPEVRDTPVRAARDDRR